MLIHSLYFKCKKETPPTDSPERTKFCKRLWKKVLDWLNTWDMEQIASFDITRPKRITVDFVKTNRVNVVGLLTT